jgi:hypothetical protein
MPPLKRLQELDAHLAAAVDLMAMQADIFTESEYATLWSLSRVARIAAANEAMAQQTETPV